MNYQNLCLKGEHFFVGEIAKVPTTSIDSVVEFYWCEWCGAFLKVLRKGEKRVAEKLSEPRMLKQAREATDMMTDHEISLIDRNNMVPCIKAIRERTGLGLKDAKDLAWKYMGEMGK